MKHFRSAALVLGLFLLSNQIDAQRIKIMEGDLMALKNEKKINVEFTYDNMSVGKFDKEADYIASKKEEYNKKEPGRGDRWEKEWISDRQAKFEPKFIELFEQESEMSTSGTKKDAKYTLIYKTTSTEPGFNVAVVRHNAETNAEVWLVEAANPTKILAKISVQRAQGRTFWGADFDTGGRIAECYAVAGKYLGKFIKKEVK